MKRLLLLFLVIAVSLTGCQPSRTVEPKDEYPRLRLSMACNGTKEAMDTLIANRIAELVARESGGNITIVVFPQEQLAGGNTQKGIAMLADGSIDLAAYAAGTLSILDDRLAVASVPWSFKSYQEARRVIDTTGGAYYEKLLADRGITYLGSAHNGLRQLSNNRRPVRTLSDMQGLRIRVPGGGVHEGFIEALGGVPVLMSWSEISTAIHQGIVDGQENGFTTTKSARLQEIQDYMTVWNYSYENYLFVANDRVFRSLNAKTQELLREKTREACEWGRDLMEKNEEKIKAEFRSSGVTISELTEEELLPFRERTRPLVLKLKEKYGEEACRAFQIP